MQKPFIYYSTAVITLMLISSAGAQEPAAALMTSMATNAKQLKRYTFKQRTETYYKGDLKNSRLDEIHYSPSGERVSVPLGEQKADSAPHRRGPGSRLVAKKVESKQGEMKAYTERLASLTGRYLAPEPGKLQSALAGADVTMVGGTNLVRVVMRNFIKPGDVVAWTFDKVTKHATRNEVTTSLDDGPVTIVLSFDQLPDGVTYPGKTVVTSTAEQLEMRVFSYDYRL